MTEATTTAQPGTGTATPEQPLQENQQPQSGQSAEQTQAEQPQYVTMEALAQREADLLRRIKQSDRDRSRKIEGELGDIKALLEQSKVQLSPEQETALRNQIVDRLDGNEPDTDEPEQQFAEAADPDDAVTSFVSDSLAGMGVELNPNSPHFAALQNVITQTWNDPQGGSKVAQAIFEYGMKERDRIANQQNNADARTLGGGGTPPTQTRPSSANDAWNKAYQK